MRRLALILLALSTGGAASPVETFHVADVTGQPVTMCEVDGYPISCAYLLALYNRIKSERYTDEGI